MTFPTPSRYQQLTATTAADARARGSAPQKAAVRSDRRTSAPHEPQPLIRIYSPPCRFRYRHDRRRRAPARTTCDRAERHVEFDDDHRPGEPGHLQVTATSGRLKKCVALIHMRSRVQVILSDEEREAFRQQAVAEKMSLSNWLRQAGLKQLEATQQRPIHNVEDLREFFATLPKEAGPEPDWESHRHVIEQSRRSGAATS